MKFGHVFAPMRTEGCAREQGGGVQPENALTASFPSECSSVSLPALLAVIALTRVSLPEAGGEAASNGLRSSLWPARCALKRRSNVLLSSPLRQTISFCHLPAQTFVLKVIRGSPFQRRSPETSPSNHDLALAGAAYISIGDKHWRLWFALILAAAHISAVCCGRPEPMQCCGASVQLAVTLLLQRCRPYVGWWPCEYADNILLSHLVNYASRFFLYSTLIQLAVGLQCVPARCPHSGLPAYCSSAFLKPGRLCCRCQTIGQYLQWKLESSDRTFDELDLLWQWWSRSVLPGPQAGTNRLTGQK